MRFEQEGFISKLNKYPRSNLRTQRPISSILISPHRWNRISISVGAGTWPKIVKVKEKCTWTQFVGLQTNTLYLLLYQLKHLWNYD